MNNAIIGKTMEQDKNCMEMRLTHNQREGYQVVLQASLQEQQMHWRAPSDRDAQTRDSLY